MLVADEGDGLFNLGGGERVEGVGRWGSARNMLGDLL